MAPTSWTDNEGTLPAEDRQTLLVLARTSIERGLQGEELRIDLVDYSERLQVPRASFVTIRVVEELRGCIGSLEATHGLAVDVVRNAHAAAFSDPRFPALTMREFTDLQVHISVLSAPESLSFASEDDLIQQLRPQIDGVILEEGTCRATYLPSVWEALPDPREFLQQLKRKAGLPPDHWSEKIKVQRYTTESIS
ncbi:MAG: AmmeMemoRadiSam system protein A [Acidiferrobacterales bacterium]